MAINGATSIWSGYNHQGKVGLLVALCEINRVIAEGGELSPDQRDRLLTEWSVDFESSREDFDVCQKIEGAKKVHSRHQVKAKTSGINESDYSKVLKPRTKTDKDGNMITIEGFDCHGVDEDHRFLHVIRDIDLSNWDNPYKVKLYTYPAVDGVQAKSYCDFSLVDADDDEMIRLALCQLKIMFGNKTDIELKVIWKDLQYQLATLISTGHRDGAIAELSFKDIYDFSLNSEIEGYDSSRFQLSLVEYWEEYVDENRDNITFTDEMYERTNGYIQDLSSLQQQDLIEIIRLMHPNESAVLRNINKDGLKQVVFKVVGEVVSLAHNGNYIKLNSHNASLILTTIANLTSEDTGSSRVAANRIIKTISEEGDVASLFMKSKIVNKSLNASFIALTDIDSDTGRIAGKDYGNISSYAPIEFISADKAILELNTEPE